MVERRATPFKVVNVIFLGFLAFMCVLPFYYVLTVSLSDPTLVKQGEVTLLPVGFSTKAYHLIFRDQTFWTSFEVTIVRTILGTVIDLALQCMIAYGISRKRLRGRRWLLFLVVFTMLFNGGIVPTYLIVRDTGLLNTIWALIIPNAISAWNVIILVSFFAAVPESIEESAKLDGANDLVIFGRLMIPLSIPAIATIGLFIAVYHWNALMDAVLYIDRSSLQPLQVYLMSLVLRTQTDNMMQTTSDQSIPTLSIQTAAIFAGTLPILVVYPFVQRYFMKGIMLGALKGE